MLALVVLLACAPDPTADVGHGPVEHEPDPPPGPGTPPPTDPPGDTGPYDPTVVHRIDITLPADSRAALDDAPKTYVPGHVVVDGRSMGEVGVRLKGSGTLRTLAGKPSFRIDLNRYTDQDLHGVEMLQLHNMVQDPSQMHERLAWAAVEAAGLPHARVSFATVTVDDAPYGLYALVEPFDDVWLARHYPDHADGNLYEGGYHDGHFDSHADFTLEEATRFDLEEGVDVEHADVLAIAAVAADDETTSWFADLGEVLDTDTFLRALAVEAWVGQIDGYLQYSNNFRIYVDPDDGRADLLVQGLDLAFIDPMMSYGQPSGVLAARCFDDAECSAAFVAAVEDVSEAIDLADLDGLREATWTLIEDELVADPRRGVPLAIVEARQEELELWFADRSQMIAHEIGENL